MLLPEKYPVHDPPLKNVSLSTTFLKVSCLSNNSLKTPFAYLDNFGTNQLGYTNSLFDSCVCPVKRINPL
ncbi:Uncharacterised protein [uncultured archaeon]|nr:Uncharacterised protein [uncultured archaeon]